METYIKIPIGNSTSSRYTYIPCSKILLVNFALANGYDKTMVRMKGSRGDVGYSLVLQDANGVSPNTEKEAQSIVFEINKIISSNPGGGIVKLGGKFNDLAEPPEFTSF
jgi:hypothetical protein